MNIVLASHNQGKIKELQQLLQPLHIEVLSQANLEISEADETGLSFIENAIIKARHASQHSKKPALADDSGLVVPALKGEPGILSARYAGKLANSAQNIEKLLAAMHGFDQDQRFAYFYCALAVVSHAKDPTPLISVGKWLGQITATACGQGGFGYDPVFYVPEQRKTAAELTPAIKNQISHRGQALATLTPLLKDKLYECTIR